MFHIDTEDGWDRDKQLAQSRLQFFLCSAFNLASQGNIPTTTKQTQQFLNHLHQFTAAVFAHVEKDLMQTGPTESDD